MASDSAVSSMPGEAAAGRRTPGAAWLTCACAWLLALAGTASAADESAPRRIVLIGGVKSEGIGQHDYGNGVRLLERALARLPEAAAAGLVVAAYPDGWPADASAFDHAATVVWYFDGLERHPLLDAARRAQFSVLMDQGVGLVALHQATTLPPGDPPFALGQWLGGMREGMFDRTTEMAELAPADHAVTRGLGPFAYHDEFYPTIRFADTGRLTPVLHGRLHVQFRAGRNLVIGEATTHPVAWAYERDGGGRSFGYSGAHYLVAFDEAPVRRLLLNAILWTAQSEVPAGGAGPGPGGEARAMVEAARLPRVKDAVVTRAADDQLVEFDWGRIVWHASGPLGNSDSLTVGHAIIRPGRRNPRHYHPNCDEVLHVLQGRILHTMDDRTVEMGPGDTVSIPAGVRHNAANIGDGDAVLAISFSTAWRQVVNE